MKSPNWFQLAARIFDCLNPGKDVLYFVGCSRTFYHIKTNRDLKNCETCEITEVDSMDCKPGKAAPAVVEVKNQ